MKSLLFATALGILPVVAGCGREDSDSQSGSSEKETSVDESAPSRDEDANESPVSDNAQTETELKPPSAEEITFVDRIREHPARDEPREAYAAWLETRDAERAELVRLETELRGLEYNDPRLLELQQRRSELLEENRSRWSEPIRELLGDNGWADFDGGLIDSISVSGVTDERLALLTHAPGLRRLEIRASKVGAPGMQSIARLKHLGDLSLHEVEASREALLVLGDLPVWSVVRSYGGRLDGETLQEAELERIARFDKLPAAEQRAAAVRLLNTFYFRPIPSDQPVKSIDLSQSGITDAQMRLLSVLSETESFLVSECYQLTSAGLAHLAKLDNLKRLELWDTTVESITPITNCTTLETLSVYPEYDTRMGDSGTEGLDKLTNLRELFLSDRAIGDATLERIGALTRLKKLDLTLARLTDEDKLAALTKLTDLKELSFHGVTLSDDALRHLAPLTELHSLSIDVEKGDGMGLRHLAGLSNLTYLKLSGDGATDAGIGRLGSLRKLRTVMAQHSKITKAGAEQLAAKLPGVTIILDEHVVKSPRESYRLRRRSLQSVASALFPVDWRDDARFTHQDTGIGVIEDGWERVGGYSGRHVAPAIIRMSLLPAENYRSAEDAMMRSVNNNSHLNPQILKRNVRAIADAKQSASCIYENDYARYLVCAGRFGDWMLLLDCETASSRFETFEPLFLHVARSIRLGGEATRHAEKTRDVPVAEMQEAGRSGNQREEN